MKPLSEAGAVSILEGVGAVLNGHFIGTQGNHLPVYVNKDVPTRYPARLRDLASGLADRTLPHEVDVVVAPPMGAINLGGLVAEQLGVQFAYLEEEAVSGGTVLAVKRPPFMEAVRDHEVGIVEDVITSGKTTEQAIAAVKAAGGKVVWLACLWNREGHTEQSLHVPMFFPLINRRLDSFSDEDCRLCDIAKPINRHPGHGHKYEQDHPDYPGGYID